MSKSVHMCQSYSKPKVCRFLRHGADPAVNLYPTDQSQISLSPLKWWSVWYRCIQVCPACITYFWPDSYRATKVTQLRQRCPACISYELLTTNLSWQALALLGCWYGRPLHAGNRSWSAFQRSSFCDGMDWFVRILVVRLNSDLLCQSGDVKFYVSHLQSSTRLCAGPNALHLTYRQCHVGL